MREDTGGSPPCGASLRIAAHWPEDNSAGPENGPAPGRADRPASPSIALAIALTLLPWNQFATDEAEAFPPVWALPSQDAGPAARERL